MIHIIRDINSDQSEVMFKVNAHSKKEAFLKYLNSMSEEEIAEIADSMEIYIYPIEGLVTID